MVAGRRRTAHRAALRTDRAGLQQLSGGDDEAREHAAVTNEQVPGQAGRAVPGGASARYAPSVATSTRGWAPPIGSHRTHANASSCSHIRDLESPARVVTRATKFVDAGEALSRAGLAHSLVRCGYQQIIQRVLTEPQIVRPEGDPDAPT